MLREPISNGHAARMRYFRYRSTVTKSEGGSGKSKSSDKGRVSKTKSGKSGVKSEIGGSYIKSEFSQMPLSHYSPASTTSPYLSDNRDDFGARFLTPCSDDMSSRGLSVNPAALEDMTSGPGAPAFSPALDFMGGSGNMHTSDFSLFDEAAFDISKYTGDGQADTHQNFDDFSNDWNDRLHQF